VRIRLASAGVLFVALSVPLGAAEPPGAIAWTDWSDTAFARARADGRLVLLDLGAVWCHWCHVMEETTYKDPEVVSLIQTRFVAVRVDQDARPDLSNRYEDYGWPATVVFDSAGQELVKFQGYIEPERMRGLLRALIADPTPGPSVENATGPSVGEGAALTDAERRDLQAILVNRYDTKHGGWGTSHKYLDWDSVEWCLLRAREGDRSAEHMARETLDRQLKLIDPVWGGVYQYSDSGDWDHPHFEKIMSMQAEDLRLYAQAHAQLGDARYLQAARDIHKFLTTFLRAPEGAFYVSQDADVVRGEHSGAYFKLGDAERRARGLPRVDTHLYTRETAWAATALLALYAATGEEALRRDAVKAADWILANRAIEGGGFRHDAVDVAGPYLGDSVAAARARAPRAHAHLRRHAFPARGRGRPRDRGRRRAERSSGTPARREHHGRAGREPRVPLHRQPRPSRAGGRSAALPRAPGGGAALQYRRRPPRGLGARARSPARDRGGRADGAGLARAARYGAARARSLQAGRAVGPGRGAAASRRRQLPAAEPARRLPVHRRTLLRARGHRRGLVPALAPGR
jgi:hypothetical protein